MPLKYILRKMFPVIWEIVALILNWSRQIFRPKKTTAGFAETSDIIYGIVRRCYRADRDWATRSKARVCRLCLDGIVGSNPAGGIDVCVVQ